MGPSSVLDDNLDVIRRRAGANRTPDTAGQQSADHDKTDDYYRDQEAPTRSTGGAAASVLRGARKGPRRNEGHEDADDGSAGQHTPCQC